MVSSAEKTEKEKCHVELPNCWTVVPHPCLRARRVPVTAKEILEIQRRLTEEGNSLSLVNAKAHEIEQEIGRLKGSAPPAPNFATDRESLLAEIAIGKATDADLKAFDRDAADSTKKYDSTVRGIREKAAPLEATVAGLKRKATHHAAEIDRLRAEHRHLCLDLLMFRCEEAGARYASAVRDAVAAMDAVIVLASLHKRAGGTNFIGEGVDQFNAMPLGTDSSRGVLPPLDSASNERRFNAAETAILDLLKSEGIAVPFPNANVAAPAKAVEPQGLGLRLGTLVDQLRPPEPLRTGTGEIAPTHAITEE